MSFVREFTLRRAKQQNWQKKFDDFRPGDTVKVHVRIKEGEKERTQIYSGVCIKAQGAGFGHTFTVRKMSAGVGVERTFPYASPNVEKVERVIEGKVRRGRLFYLRGLKGRAARLKSEAYSADDVDAPGAADEVEAKAAPAPKAEKSEKSAKSDKAPKA